MLEGIVQRANKIEHVNPFFTLMSLTGYEEVSFIFNNSTSCT